MHAIGIQIWYKLYVRTNVYLVLLGIQFDFVCRLRIELISNVCVCDMMSNIEIHTQKQIDRNNLFFWFQEEHETIQIRERVCEKGNIESEERWQKRHRILWKRKRRERWARATAPSKVWALLTLLAAWWRMIDCLDDFYKIERQRDNNNNKKKIKPKVFKIAFNLL